MRLKMRNRIMTIIGIVVMVLASLIPSAAPAAWAQQTETPVVAEKATVDPADYRLIVHTASESSQDLFLPLITSRGGPQVATAQSANPTEINACKFYLEALNSLNAAHISQICIAQEAYAKTVTLGILGNEIVFSATNGKEEYWKTNLLADVLDYQFVNSIGTNPRDHSKKSGTRVTFENIIPYNPENIGETMAGMSMARVPWGYATQWILDRLLKPEGTTTSDNEVLFKFDTLQFSAPSLNAPSSTLGSLCPGNHLGFPVGWRITKTGPMSTIFFKMYYPACGANVNQAMPWVVIWEFWDSLMNDPEWRLEATEGVKARVEDARSTRVQILQPDGSIITTLGIISVVIIGTLVVITILTPIPGDEVVTIGWFITGTLATAPRAQSADMNDQPTITIQQP